MKLPSQRLKLVKTLGQLLDAQWFFDNVKMSKSLGNFITVHDALKTIDGQASFSCNPSTRPQAH